MRNNKRGLVSLGDAPGVALQLVLIAAIFVAGFLVVTGLGDSTTNADAGFAVANITEGMSNITGYMPTIGVIVGVAILLGIVIGGFGFARNKGYL